MVIEKITPVDPKINAELSKKYEGGIFGDKPNFVQVGAKKWFFPERYTLFAEKYKNFKVRPDDVFVTGYPRSGTSMTADICWFLTHELDFQRSKDSAFNERSKLFELNTLFDSSKTQIKNEDTKKIFNTLLETLDNDTERRCIKTHLPFELLPEDLLTCGAKVVYIARYVKDAAISFYNLQSTPTRENFQGTFEDFWNLIENNHVSFTPYFEHLKQGFEKRYNKNVLVIFYEEQRHDLKGSIKKIADFLGKQLTEEELNALADYMNIENYKKVANKTNFFNDKFEHVRKGEVGGWKKYFPENLNRSADQWINKNLQNMNMKYNGVSYEFLQ